MTRSVAPAGLELVFELELGFFDSLLLFTAAPTFDPAACAERKHRSRGLALVQRQGGGDDKFQFFKETKLSAKNQPNSIRPFIANFLRSLGVAAFTLFPHASA